MKAAAVMIALAAGLGAQFALIGIARELHAIHYEMVLRNCIAMAEDGVTCDAAKGKAHG
jgi:hypothetical protein